MLVCRPPPPELNLPVIPASAYAAALKEYEDLDKTDSEGDDLSWWFVSFVVFLNCFFFEWCIAPPVPVFPCFILLLLFSYIMWYFNHLYVWYLFIVVHIALFLNIMGVFVWRISSQYSLCSLCTATCQCNYEVTLNRPYAIKTIRCYISANLCYKALCIRGLSMVLP